MAEKKPSHLEGLGERIRLLRGRSSRERFAQRLGIHRNTLARYETNQRLPDAALLQRICAVAGVPPEWLLDGGASRSAPRTDGFVAPRWLTEPEGVVTMKLRRDWLARHGLSEGGLRLHTVTDAAMVPTMATGDVLLVDCGEPLLSGEASVVVLRLDGVSTVRRLSRIGATMVRLDADNPAYRPLELPLDAVGRDGEHPVLARVCWQLRPVRHAPD